MKPEYVTKTYTPVTGPSHFFGGRADTTNELKTSKTALSLACKDVLYTSLKSWLASAIPSESASHDIEVLIIFVCLLKNGIVRKQTHKKKHQVQNVQNGDRPGISGMLSTFLRCGSTQLHGYRLLVLTLRLCLRFRLRPLRLLDLSPSSSFGKIVENNCIKWIDTGSHGIKGKL